MIDYYETLEVHPKASQEIIKKAYQTLAKKYHPDVYSDKEFANKKMRLLNDAYNILSNSEKRKFYDQKLNNCSTDQPTKQYTSTDAGDTKNNVQENISPDTQRYFDARLLAKLNGEKVLDKSNVCLRTLNGFGATFYGAESCDRSTTSYITQYWISLLYFPVIPLGKYRVINRENSYLIISKIPFKKTFHDMLSMYASRTSSLIAWLIIFSIIIFSFMPSSSTKVTSGNKTSTPPQTSSSNTKKQLVPQKDVVTQYIPNEPIFNSNGHGIITIDNSQNSIPVYVRIWSIDKPEKPVRTITIAPHGKFSVKNITPGKYDVRYKYLYENTEANSGSKSEPIILTEKETNSGTQYDTLTLTLYKVHNGNTRTTSIPADQI